MRDVNRAKHKGEGVRNQGMVYGEVEQVGEYARGRLHDKGRGDIELNVVERGRENQGMKLTPWAVTSPRTETERDE